ncbi:hypothetical protein [Acinetobacter baumannii]|uniref:hypothetical protein n=1 Tax=Acinetobacter baumannii TaxID=470 RepID=UPI0010A90F87|nr:hypothetical protein [Acinetobacter baumannii]THV29921.1 hypothetical protein FAU78_13120 [Acinetobacter baumannii]
MQLSLELLERVFRSNQNDPNKFMSRLKQSPNPKHVLDVVAASEMLQKANLLIHDLMSNGQKQSHIFKEKKEYESKDQIFTLRSDDDSNKFYVYVFHLIPENSLTVKFSYCLGTLNAPNVFGPESALKLKGVLLNIFELHLKQEFIFPSWCNVFYINNLTSRAMPNIALSSIEDQLSNPLDFFPDAIETLKMYSINIKNIDLDIMDMFVSSDQMSN